VAFCESCNEFYEVDAAKVSIAPMRIEPLRPIVLSEVIVNIATELFKPQREWHQRFTFRRQAQLSRTSHDKRSSKLVFQALYSGGDIRLHGVQAPQPWSYCRASRRRERREDPAEEIGPRSICLSDTTHLDKSFFDDRFPLDLDPCRNLINFSFW
jgi:hypothetical protein